MTIKPKFQFFLQSPATRVKETTTFTDYHRRSDQHAYLGRDQFVETGFRFRVKQVLVLLYKSISQELLFHGIRPATCNV